MNQGAGDADAVFHALGQGVDVLLPDAVEVGKVLDFRHHLPAFDAVQPIGAGEEIEVFVDRNITMIGQRVRHVADHFVGLLGFLDQRHAVHQGVAGRGLVQGGQDAHGRALAGAVGPTKPKICPDSNENEMPFTARVWPKCLCKS